MTVNKSHLDSLGRSNQLKTVSTRCLKGTDLQIQMWQYIDILASDSLRIIKYANYYVHTHS